MTPLHEVARIGHAELLTPTPEESLRFFADVLGMEEEAREGQSVYLRGWGDYLRYSLKLTESETSRPRSRRPPRLEPEALERRVAAIEETGLGRGWIDGDVGHGPRSVSRTPTATGSSSSTRPSGTSRPST